MYIYYVPAKIMNPKKKLSHNVAMNNKGILHFYHSRVSRYSRGRGCGRPRLLRVSHRSNTPEPHPRPHHMAPHPHSTRRHASGPHGASSERADAARLAEGVTGGRTAVEGGPTRGCLEGISRRHDIEPTTIDRVTPMGCITKRLHQDV